MAKPEFMKVTVNLTEEQRGIVADALLKQMECNNKAWELTNSGEAKDALTKANTELRQIVSILTKAE